MSSHRRPKSSREAPTMNAPVGTIRPRSIRKISKRQRRSRSGIAASSSTVTCVNRISRSPASTALRTVSYAPRRSMSGSIALESITTLRMAATLPSTRRPGPPATRTTHLRPPTGRVGGLTLKSQPPGRRSTVKTSLTVESAATPARYPGTTGTPPVPLRQLTLQGPFSPVVMTLKRQPSPDVAASSGTMWGSHAMARAEQSARRRTQRSHVKHALSWDDVRPSVLGVKSGDPLVLTVVVD